MARLLRTARKAAGGRYRDAARQHGQKIGVPLEALAVRDQVVGPGKSCI